MNTDSHDDVQAQGELEPQIPNGAAAAAILSAAVGCFSVGVCGLLGDAFPAIAHSFSFSNPTGPLSGETTTAIAIWLILWFILSKMWSAKDVPLKTISLVSFLLLGLGVLLTFPPFGDLLQGK